MTLDGLIPLLDRAESFTRALDFAGKSVDYSTVDGLRVPLTAALAARQAERQGRAQAVFVITATTRDADRVRHAFETLTAARVIEIPAWETLPHERLSPSADIVGRRIEALRAIADWQRRREAGEPVGQLVVLAAVRAALQPVADNLTSVDPIELRLGQRDVSTDDILRRLVELAYTRVDMVTRRGEFAVRGGIIDVFSPTAEHPVRIDFFGDEVDEMRVFSVADQRSTDEAVTEVSLPPCRELLLDEGVRQRARELKAELPNLEQVLEKVADGIPVEGMEALTPVLAARLVPITAYLPGDSLVFVYAPERVATRALSLTETNREFLEAAWSAATAGARAPIDLGSGDFLTLTQLRERSSTAAWSAISPFDLGDAESELAAAGSLEAGTAGGTAGDEDASGTALPADLGTVRVLGERVASHAGDPDGALSLLRERLRAGWRIVVTLGSKGALERTKEVLAGAELAAREVVDLGEAVRGASGEGDDSDGVIWLTLADVEASFEQGEARVLIISDNDFYGRRADYGDREGGRRVTRRRNVVDPLQLKRGDYVVHETHGIGRFVEMMQREVRTGGPRSKTTTREYLVLEYAPSKRGHPADRLFVSTDQLDRLTRYVGGEAPQLSKMGGSDWASQKSRARRAVRDIAVELVKLYSARMASKGYAFGPDTPWQRELEESFPYVETPDQLQAIEDIKRDMERQIPMDRLISGDVGFGKTEVAVRAAFKAVQDGKQVAVLVPTTLLVRQHTETFVDRFAGFPVNVRPLSRFQGAKESKETIAGLADGTVDVVIGTHRLLSGEVKFKDLGLVVIDEEQRFGVEHKEALKKLKHNVDILAMSATPIPRTLEMAVTGIRETSTLATPPEDRHPILTYVGAYTDRQVAAAIKRELLREGQVFFVHNRTSSIQAMANRLAELVPEARIAIAHGKMSEAALERVIIDFWDKKYDVLVCTTIIETGLDIANANTLIVDRADKYGLSQLHQLRGRVGRGRERAYAYFLYDAERPLTETSADRLETIAANNELGAGMQVALKDLEIRGAGNLLGGEQSGHIAGVGFDLYLRMIGEAVDSFKGEDVERRPELRLEIPVDARIPDFYVDSERLRLEAYQKLSAASQATAKPGQIALVLDELEDRYGKAPEEVQRLIQIAHLRRMAQAAGITEVLTLGQNIRIALPDLADSMQIRLQRLHRGSHWNAAKGEATLPLPEWVVPGETDDRLVDWVRGVLTTIFGAVDDRDGGGEAVAEAEDATA